MFSDLLESPPKENYLFNDQSSTYDMSEVNEISNQTNLDYIFDSYYTSVSDYNTDFNLPEDCKNMSFSELFDQELFSTHENKDCKLSIKIEKEESLNPCFSAGNSQDTNVNHNSLQIKENVSSSTPSKSFAPKPGINRTYIKVRKICNVERLIHNPFDDPTISAISDDQILKCELEAFENISEPDEKPWYIVDDSQNADDSHSSIQIEDFNQSSLSEITAQKHLANNNISIKTENRDTEHLTANAGNLVYDQIPVKIKKCEPIEINDNFDMENNPCYSIESYNQTDNHGLVKSEDKIQSLLTTNSTLKHPLMNKISVKNTENCDIITIDKNLSNNLSKPKNVGLGQMLVKIKLPFIKREPEEVNDVNDMKIKPYSINSQNQVDSLMLVKCKDNIQYALSKSSTPKQSVINQISLKTSKNCDTYNLSKTKNLSLNQMPVKIKTPIVKCEPEDINDIIEKDIEMEMKHCFPLDNSQNITENCDQVNINNNFSSLLSQSFTSKCQGIDETSLKSTENLNTKYIHNPICQPDGQVDNQMIGQVKIPVIKCEPEHSNDTVDQHIDGMEIQHEENLLEKLKYTASNDFCCTTLNNTNIKSKEIVHIKKDNMISSITSVKDDIESLKDTIKNEIILENEKKKISWEEYKAKIGKMGLLKISEDNDESAKNLAATNNDKLEAIIEEFDRNTAEHFIGQKRKIEDKEEITIAKETNSEEEQELQNKRMKIEYIKKLLPSSFASEIAKTSSLMKGNYVDDNENESTSDDSIVSTDKISEKITDIHENLKHFKKKDDKYQKKLHQTRVNSFHRNSTRPDYGNKNSRLSSSNPDDNYNRNRIDVPQNGQYNQNIRSTVQRSRDQKRVVYVGQIPIKFGKHYLYNRFKTFGTIQSLTLHKKPDFRVYYAFVTYSEKSEAESAINHGNDDKTQVQLDIRFGERKQTQTPYYDLDDEWLTDWYGYNQPVPVVKAHSPEKTSFEEELQEFYKLAQIKKLNQNKPSPVS